jgi:hypothetical protein
MAIQTTYAARHLPAYEGMIANSEDHTIVSKQVETAAGIGFGKVACQGSADDGIVIAAATKFLGLTEAAHNAGVVGGTVDLYAQYETIPVMTKGVMWVMASEAVAPGDPVYYTAAGGALSKTASGNVLIPNARWDSSTSGAGLAKARLG